MTAQILDGKAISEEILAGVEKRVRQLRITPGLAAILVGDDEASRAYVGMKREAAEKNGFYSVVKEFGGDAGTQQIIEAINAFNDDEKIHGVLVQLPLPQHVDKAAVLEAIALEKDVDGLIAASLGAIVAKQKTGFVPATALGVMELLKHAGGQLAGKSACVIGEGVQTGRPIALLLLNEMATVTVCNVFTKNLGEETRNADVVVSCVGKPNLVKGDMVKDGAIVIDVGISKTNGRIAGDVDFDSVSKKASFITPVPGGVGPMTVAMLLRNTLYAAEKQLETH